MSTIINNRAVSQWDNYHFDGKMGCNEMPSIYIFFYNETNYPTQNYRYDLAPSALTSNFGERLHTV